ncbi:two-component sensor histidine kinase [Kitasatospora xanthocidica]|uniref:sensor histidine kinase n=1 Tax=Kitasatospora xanthocidica TaxID=83382 RepID=UPI001674F7CC|nr:histidine kinase [Kitasatospora xanthocidica]GHF78172.1 two-component sensor histidine kinase [Kitasatospora xanthocidica]
MAVGAALVAVHLLKGLARVPAQPGAGAAVVAACLALVVLQSRHTRPGADGGPVRAGWTVAELAVAFLAVGPLGVSVGLLCLPAASLLLERRRPLRRLLLPPFVGAAVLAAAVRSASVRDTVDLLLTVALGGVMLYTVTRLALLAAGVHAARLTLAASAVTDERLRIASSLRSELSEGLARIRGLAVRADPSVLDPLIAVARGTLAAARATTAELRSLSLAPEAASARALLASAGVAADIRIGHREPLGPAGTVLATVLRESVTAVVRVGDARRCEVSTGERAGRVVLRVVSDGMPTAALGADLLDDLADRVRAVGGRLTAGLEPDGRFAVEASVAATAAPRAAADPSELRTALGLYYFLLAAFGARVLLFVPATVSGLGLGVACVLAFCAVQVRVSVHGVTRHLRSALLASAVLALVPLPWLGRNWIGAAGILAGSLLVALPLRAGAAAAAVLVVAAGVIGGGAPVSGLSALSALSTTVSVMITCVVVYAVLRLVRLVREFQRAGAGLARAAVVTERLRAARDLHDLLGHGLAAIVLKAELARRLADVAGGGIGDAAGGGSGGDSGGDSGDAAEAAGERCRAELADIVRLAERGQSELGAVAEESPRLSFAAELTSAAAVLEAAAITVELEDVPVPGEAGAVLGVALREAVTNILRHSHARHARIATSVTGDVARLEVENDGVREGVTAPGSGIGGLTVRLAEAGGTLTAGPDDGWYLLRAELPLHCP